jgi:hypothetical protein
VPSAKGGSLVNTYVGIDIYESFSQIRVHSQQRTCIHPGRVYRDDLAKLREFFAQLASQVQADVAGTAG